MERDYEFNPLETVEFPVMTAVEAIFKHRGNKPISMVYLIYLVEDRCNANHDFTEWEMAMVGSVIGKMVPSGILEHTTTDDVRMNKTYWEALKTENTMFRLVVPNWQVINEWEEEGEQ